MRMQNSADIAIENALTISTSECADVAERPRVAWATTLRTGQMVSCLCLSFEPVLGFYRRIVITGIFRWCCGLNAWIRSVAVGWLGT